MAESWTLPELLNAGWTEADLEWETAAVNAFEAYASGSDTDAARQRLGECVQLARKHFRCGTIRALPPALPITARAVG